MPCTPDFSTPAPTTGAKRQVEKRKMLCVCVSGFTPLSVFPQDMVIVSVLELTPHSPIALLRLFSSFVLSVAV